MSKRVKTELPVFVQSRKVLEAGNGLKILSMNIPGLRGLLGNKERKKKLDAVLKVESPDILMLQETKLQEIHMESEPVKSFVNEQMKDYEQFWNFSTAKKGYSGVATFLRKSLDLKIIKHQKELPNCSVFKNEGRIIILELEKFCLVNCYTPNSGSKLERLEQRTKTWDRHFASCLKELQQTKPVIAMGDLNCAYRTKDIHNLYKHKKFPDLEFLSEEEYTGNKAIMKQAGCTLEERRSFALILEETDMVDAFAHQYPEAQGAFTYWTHMHGNRPVNHGLRLDYILCSKQLMNESKPESILDVFHLDDLDRDGVWGISDHCPIGCVLKV